jgi:hypothetical protein
MHLGKLRSWSVVCIIILLLAGLLLFGENEQSPNTSLRPKNNAGQQRTGSVLVARSLENFAVPANSHLQIPKRYLVFADALSKDMQDYSLDQGFNFLKNPSAWIEMAQRGDGRAARLIYETLSNCLIFSDSSDKEKEDFKKKTELLGGELANDCRSIPSAYADNKAYFLDASASNGDPLSQYLYGQDLVSSALLQQRNGSLQVLAEEYNKSIMYLQNAASYGVEQAYLELAHIYSSGAFGRQDPILAASYITALQELRELSGFSQLPEHIIPKTRTGDHTIIKENARRIVEECCKKIN